MSACLAWQVPVEAISSLLAEKDVASLRESARDWRTAVDRSVHSLRPTSLNSPLLQSRALPGLKSLRIDQLYLLQPQQLECIGRLSQLTQLSLGGSCLSCVRNQHLAFISRLTNLQHLSIRGCPRVHLSVLSHWHTLTRLRSLTLIGSAFSAATDTSHLQTFLAATGAPSSLTRLVLGDSQGLSFLSDHALEGLGSLLGPGNVLQELDLSGCIDITDAGMRQLGGLSGLQQLKLHNCMKLNAGAVPVLAAFTALTQLSLRGCSQFSDAHVAQLLQRLGRLQHLNLQSCGGLTGSFLGSELCRSLGVLATLNVSYCQGLAPGFVRQLRRLPGLRRLDLSGCGVVSGAEVLQLLGRAVQLRELVGANWRLKGGSASDDTQQQEQQQQLDGPVPQDCGVLWDDWRRAGSCGEGGSSSQQQARKKMRAEQQDQDPQQVAALPVAQLVVPPQLQLLHLPNLVCEAALLQGIMNSLPPSLTALDLANCRVPGYGAGAACLRPLGRLCPQLASLNLSGGSGGLAETALAFLSGMTGLTALHVDHVFAERQGFTPHDVDSGCPKLLGSSCGSFGGSSSCGSGSSGSFGSDSSSSSYSSSLGGGAGSTGACSSSSSSAHTAGGGAHAGVAALLGTSPLSGKLLAASSNSDGSGVAAADDAAPEACQLPQPAVVRRSLFGGLSSAMQQVAAAADGSCASAATAADMRPAATQLQMQLLLAQRQQPHYLQQLGCLQRLSIRFSPWLDDRVLAALAGLVRTSLVSLELVACHGFSGTGFSSWGPGGQQLTLLNFTGCSGLNDAGLQCLARALAGGQQLQQQQGCGAAQAAWGGSGCGVRELVLAGCKGFGDDGAAALAALSSLRLLSLSSNRDITSRAMAALFPALRHLRHLQLASCSGLDDAALSHLAAGPALTTADVRGCWKLTDAGVFDLLWRSPSLLQISVECCHRLSGGCVPPSFHMADADGSGRPASGAGGSSGSGGTSDGGGGSGGSGGSRPSLLVRVSMAGTRPGAGPAAAAAEGPEGDCCRTLCAVMKERKLEVDGEDDGGLFGDLSALVI